LSRPHRLTIVGSSPSIPRPDRASSCYLLSDGDSSLALDFGHGAFANISRYVDYHSLRAIVVSHMHADHFLDLIPLRYALRYGRHGTDDRVALFLPPGGLRTLDQIASAISEGDAAFLSETFELREYDPDGRLLIDDAELSFAPTRHYIEAYAIRYRCRGVTVTYSADTAPEERVIRLARESDLFLCESTLLPGETEPGRRGHCAPAESGAMAAEAGVKRLLLTHYPREASVTQIGAAARGAFRKEVTIVDDHDVVDLETVYTSGSR
jgi:ribonuclease BN (tRNA processing enzyme)